MSGKQQLRWIFYELAKSKTQEEFIDHLKKYDQQELKYAIKLLKFNYNSSTSVETLSKYIFEQIQKRTTDVFRAHQSET